MKKLLFGGLAIVGGGYVAKVTASYFLTRYKKEIKEFVIEKVVSYFLTDENGEVIDDDELIMAAAKAYLKKKGAK